MIGDDEALDRCVDCGEFVEACICYNDEYDYDGEDYTYDGEYGPYDGEVYDGEEDE